MMKKRTADKFWFPFWPDKWIFGSMRIECSPAERGIWVDLLSLASKDDGHIRANEDTPYPLTQLAGMLIIPEEELEATIKKFVDNKKLTLMKSGTLHITKWDKYQFSERHKRRVEEEMSEKTDIVSAKKDAILYNNKLNNISIAFEKWFQRYPNKADKGKAKSKYFTLIEHEGVDPKELEDALTGYINCLHAEGIDDIRFIKHAKTFLYNGNKKKGIESTWRPYIKYADKKYRRKPEL